MLAIKRVTLQFYYKKENILRRVGFYGIIAVPSFGPGMEFFLDKVVSEENEIKGYYEAIHK